VIVAEVLWIRVKATFAFKGRRSHFRSFRIFGSGGSGGPEMVRNLTRVRSRLSRIPFASAPLLFAVEDQVKIQIVLEDQIRDALTELSSAQ
jgi:hypothetical protein